MRLDLVLVKGPLDLPRRLGIPLKSGKPTVVGRSPESDVRLEPQMSFCSGTHARFHFTRPRSKKDSSLSYFVTDAGSSNGTFVNEVKISSLQATKLEHGDRIILGGSHGASEGEKLPPEHILSPDVIEWAVDLDPDNPSEFSFTATTEMGVSAESDDEFLAEEKLLATELLKRLKQATERKAAEGPPSTGRKREGSNGERVALDMSDSASPKRRRQELKTEKVEVDAGGEAVLVSADFKLDSTAKRNSRTPNKNAPSHAHVKSVSIPAPISKSPPTSISLNAVRLGKFSTKSLSGTSAGITFSDTHWKWTMPDPQGSPAPMKVMLPITSVAAFMFNASEKILVLSLRDGVHVPFVEDKIFAGNRTIAFNVEDARGIGRIIDAYYSQYRFPRLTELNERDAARLAPRSS